MNIKFSAWPNIFGTSALLLYLLLLIILFITTLTAASAYHLPSSFLRVEYVYIVNCFSGFCGLYVYRKLRDFTFVIPVS